jgi:hypothetical protein
VQDQTVADLTSTLLRARDAADTFKTGMEAALNVDKVASELKTAEGELAKINAAMAGMPDRPTENMNELARAARMAADKVAELRQKMASPGGSDKDTYQQDEEALRHYENTSRTTRASMLQGEIAMMQQELATQQLTDGERQRLTDKLESAQHQLWETTSKEGQRAAKDAEKATLESLQTQIAEVQRSTADEIKLIELKVKARVLGAKEGEAATLAALKSEEAAIDALYSKELALAGQTQTQIGAIKRKQELEDLTINDQMTLNAQKAADATQAAWDKAGNTILSAWNSQLKGMLEGTTNFRTAAANIARDLSLKAIEAGEQTLVRTIAQYATGLAAKKASDIQAVGGDAGRAAAGAYAATAEIPIVGPFLAPAAAATAFAATEGFAAFDIGAWSIPHDMPAVVHRNELVMPAAEAGVFRSMLSGAANGGAGGGGNVSVNPAVHLNVQAVDGASVNQFFRNNHRSLMNSIDEAVRHGAALGTRRLRFT